jgi:hypothetical protein
MGCPALGVSVAFFKQPALPSKAPQKKKLKIKKNHKKSLIKNHKKIKSSSKYIFFIF